MTVGEFWGSISLLFPGMDSVTQTVALAGVCAILLTPLERLVPAAPQPLVWRKGFWLDAAYWFLTPILTRAVTGAILALLLFVGVWSIGFENISSDVLVHGFGPLSHQPTWLQCLEILLLSDFVDYWTHRGFHLGPLWRVHAIHHSPQEMNWISSSRVHPLNDLLTRCCQLLPIIIFGFSAISIISVVPLVAFYVMFLHSNVKWGFGPLRWVLVSPAYHRWHHTTDKEGIDKNFAGIFPIWDVLFGTAYFPRSLPKSYGLTGEQIPESLLAHLVYPFRRSGGVAAEGGPGPSFPGNANLPIGRAEETPSVNQPTSP
ncbi:sterol desaturase family protein [soil metagenome]